MFENIYTPAEWVLNNKNPSPKQRAPPDRPFGLRQVCFISYKYFNICIKDLVLN